MKPNHVLVFGGTSDALMLCEALAARDIHFTLSVATEEGKHSAKQFESNVILGRMDSSAMREFIQRNHVDYVIDAAHPYAQVLRLTIVVACEGIQCPVMRYERPSYEPQVSHSTLESATNEKSQSIHDSPLVIKATNVMDACRKITGSQQRVLLTTGSKDLETFKRMLRDKVLFARVLPVAEVISECNALGLGIENIIAMKGPFTRNMNHALYEMLQPDVVITKESGSVGGFGGKVEPCIELGIPCIVIERPKTTSINQYVSYQTNLSGCEELFDSWQQEACLV
ncbi:precorrin-6A reductase [Vibrio ziniensis]|uniref:Precorrin-6A reductase n=1 Tax=Vibrio ziniensis TaxID=2711221 RepID=A0A6G7CIG0_9VIBR|nr:precorrin-6A reductase [Vibrio ziniensis]QIH41860.1 precorrin-6A reductase [Vibrio ziniensis]